LGHFVFFTESLMYCQDSAIKLKARA